MKRRYRLQGRASFVSKLREKVTQNTSVVKDLIVQASTIVQSLPEVAQAIPPTSNDELLPSLTAPSSDAWIEPQDKQPEAEEIVLAPEFTTVTMGNLLLSQGRIRDAERVFRFVLAHNPTDAQALAGLAKCLPQAQPTVPSTSDEPTSMLDRVDPPMGYNVSSIRVLPVNPTTLVIFWELAKDDLANALAAHDGKGVLTLRLQSTIGEGRAKETITRLITGVLPTGEHFVRGVSRGSGHSAEIGLLLASEFFPIISSSATRTPRGKPTDVVAVVRGTLAMPPRAQSAQPQSPQIVEIRGPKPHLETFAVAHFDQPQSMPIQVQDTQPRPAAFAPVGIVWKSPGIEAWLDEHPDQRPGVFIERLAPQQTTAQPSHEETTEYYWVQVPEYSQQSTSSGQWERWDRLERVHPVPSSWAEAVASL